MTAAWYRARAQLRGSWRSALVLALLVGLAGGVVLATLAGARRSASAEHRYREASLVGHATFFHPDPDPALVRRVADLPQVEAFGPIAYFGLAPMADGVPVDEIGVAASRDGRVFRDVDRIEVVQGRLPEPTQPSEAAVDPVAAERLDVGVGDRVSLTSFDEEGVRPAVVEVVGIVNVPLQVLTEDRDGIVLVSGGFAAAHPRDLLAFYPARVRLAGGFEDFAAFTEAATAIFDGSPDLFIESSAEEQDRVQIGVEVLVVSLVVFSVVAGLAGLVAVATALARAVPDSAEDQATLAAVGMTQRERAASLLLSSAPVAVVGAMVSAAVAVAASPLFPLDPARRFELDRGVRVDAAVVLVGSVSVAVIVLVLSGVTAWRSSVAVGSSPIDQERRAGPAASSIVTLLRRLPAVATGVRMALLPGRGRTAVPVRPALAGAVVGVLGVVATLTFGASLAKLVNEPELAGWNWDVALRGIEGVPAAKVIDRVEPDLADVGGVEGAAALRVSTADLAGKETQLLGFEGLKGSIGPTLIEGRTAANASEVVLGSETMRRLGVGIGDRIEAAGVEGPVDLVVVGRGVFATETEEVADGGALTMEGLDALDAYVGTTDVVIDWSPAADRETGLRRLGEIAERHQGIIDGEPLTRMQPLQVHNLARVDALPKILGAFLAVVAAVAVVHALVTSVRRRRRDLAVLRAVGFVRRQVSVAVACQSTTMVLVGVLVGGPLGVAVGRLTWSSVARTIGVVDAPTVPFVDIGAAVLASVLVALGLSVLPARRARRDQPALVLRSE